MADNHIEINANTNTRLGYELRNAIDALAQARAQLKQLYTVMQEMHDGVNYTVVEARFGVPAGKGAVLPGLLLSATQELDADVVVNQMLNWCEAKV